MTFYRLFRWHRASGATRCVALRRAWRKWREPDPFQPFNRIH